MEKALRHQFQNDQWETLIFDGTKPPVTDPIRKHLKRLKEPVNHSIKSIPIVITFFFESGDIHVQPRPRIPKKNHDENYDLNLHNDLPSPNIASPSRSSIENLVLEQIHHIKTMTIDKQISSPSTTNDFRNVLLPLKNDSNIIDAPSDSDNRLMNALSPLPNINQLMNSLSPLNNNELLTIGESLDKASINEVPENDESYDMTTLPDELVQLYEENQNTMKEYDEKIKKYDEKVKKFSKQLEEMHCMLKNLVKEKQKTKTELSAKFRERYRSWKKKQSDIQTHKKRPKRLGVTGQK